MLGWVCVYNNIAYMHTCIGSDVDDNDCCFIKQDPGQCEFAILHSLYRTDEKPDILIARFLPCYVVSTIKCDCFPLQRHHEHVRIAQASDHDKALFELDQYAFSRILHRVPMKVPQLIRIFEHMFEDSNMPQKLAIIGGDDELLEVAGHQRDCGGNVTPLSITIPVPIPNPSILIAVIPPPT